MTIQRTSIAFGLLVSLCIAPPCLSAQSSTPGASITGTVFGTSGNPIAHPRIVLPEARQEFLGGADGTFRVGNLAPGRHRLVVRYLGYSPVDTVILVASDGSRPLTITLHRAALVLRETRTAALACDRRAAADTIRTGQLVRLLTEMQENAARFNLLVSQHPFSYQARRTYTLKRKKRLPARVIDTVSFNASVGWQYKPGHLATRRKEIRLPDLRHFADSTFLATHCFRYAGQDTLGGVSVERIDVEPLPHIQTPDMRGWIGLDPSTHMVMGTVFEVTNAPAVDRFLESFTVRTLYGQLSEGLGIFARVDSRRRYDVERLGADDAFEIDEEQITIRIHFERGLPGGDASVVPPAPPGMR